MKQKVLFIDRDGTLLKEPSDLQIDSLEKFAFTEGSISTLRQFSRYGYSLVMVSNQDGLGTPSFPTADFEPWQNLMLSVLHSEGVVFEKIFIDPHLEADNHPNRKPALGMLMPYLSENIIDKEKSFVIGDRPTDAVMAKNIGCGSLTLKLSTAFSNYTSDAWKGVATNFFSNWQEVADHVLNRPRQVMVKRKTKETNIELILLLEGTGLYVGKTGLNFFDHMLEQIARHSLANLQIKMQGDLHVDEHHTIEDVGICLGEAISKALHDKRGIERYGFFLPMDESLAHCAIDLSNRPYFKLEGNFNREYVGDFPVEMLSHFFHTLATHAKMNLYLKVEGDNVHHQIEACFKAFARALRQAVYRTPFKSDNGEKQFSAMLPSTKDNL